MFGIWMFIIYKMYTIWKQMYRYYILFGYYSNYPNQAKLRENWVEWRNENSRGILIRWASGQVSFSSGTRINSIPIVSGEIYRLLGGSCSTHASIPIRDCVQHGIDVVALCSCIPRERRSLQVWSPHSPVSFRIFRPSYLNSVSI